MSHRVRQGTAVLAAALVLAYVGAISISQLREFAPWPGDLAWLALVSVVTGLLLGFGSDNAALAMVAAAGLAVLIFAAVWGYIVWELLGQHITLLELILSNFMFLYVGRLGVIIFIVSTFFGLLGTGIVLLFVPDHYRL